MNDLLAVQIFLSCTLLTDPRLALASVTAWLDPVYLMGDVEDTVDLDEADDVRVALQICRACFPQAYAEANQLLWQGADEFTLRRYVLDGINAGLVAPLDDLEQVRYGPPIEGMGLCLDDPEFRDAFPDLADVLADFGLDPEDGLADFQVAQQIARHLADSLEETAKPALMNIAHLLNWLFSMSGNTLVDMSMEDIWDSGMDMPDWTPDDVAFVNEMTREARQILDAATAGEKVLHADPTLRAAFRQNIDRVKQALHRQGTRRSHDRLSLDLQWPDGV